MITGAGGSIGAELARQVYALRPDRVILVDRAEGPLYGIQRELEVIAKRGIGSGEVSAHIANVATRLTMGRIIRDHKPDIIFHAAAYKHVPMMEEHPSDAVHVNIGGTLSVLDAAQAHGVARVRIRVDRQGCPPDERDGASKRVAEALVTDAARRSGDRFVSVRFGNVLGSSGSVVPIFQQQLENGEPLTITHPDMTRFFMTIPEAVWLILDAAALGDPGSLMALDMGDPVRIVDLAEDLIRLARPGSADRADRVHRVAAWREAPRTALLCRGTGTDHCKQTGHAGHDRRRPARHSRARNRSAGFGRWRPRR